MAIIEQEIIDSSKLSYNTKPIKIEIADKQKAKLIQGFIKGIYADEYSWIREIICNAIDANNDKSIQTGIKVKQVDLYFTETLPLLSGINSFVIQDYGFGMDEYDIQNIYSQFGTSTKMETNDLIGNFGIGSKSPLKYSSVFYLETSKNGITYIYSIGSINNEDYGISLLTKYESDKDENNEYITGTKVIIPLKNNRGYTSEQNCIKSFIEKHFKITDEFDTRFSLNYDYLYQHIVFENDNFILLNSYKLEYYCHYGILKYNIEKLYNKLTNRPLKLNFNDIRYNIIPKFKIGELKPTQSREELMTDDFNIKALTTKLELITQDLIKLYENKLMIEYAKLDDIHGDDKLVTSTNLFINNSSFARILKNCHLNNLLKTRYQLHSIFLNRDNEYTNTNDIQKNEFFNNLFSNRHKIFEIIFNKNNKHLSRKTTTVFGSSTLDELFEPLSNEELTSFAIKNKFNSSEHKYLQLQIIIGGVTDKDLYRYYRYLSNSTNRLKNEFILIVNLDLLKQYQTEAKQLGFTICSDELISDFENFHYLNSQLLIEFENTEIEVVEKPKSSGKLKRIAGFYENYSTYRIINIIEKVGTKYADNIEFKFTESNFDLAKYAKNNFVVYCSLEKSDIEEFALFYIKYRHLNWDFFKLSEKHINYCKTNDIGVYYKDVDKDILNMLDYYNHIQFQLSNTDYYKLEITFPETMKMFDTVFDFLGIKRTHNALLTHYNTHNNVDFTTCNYELSTIFNEFEEYLANFNFKNKTSYSGFADFIDWFKIVNQHYGNKFN